MSISFELSYSDIGYSDQILPIENKSYINKKHGHSLGYYTVLLQNNRNSDSLSNDLTNFECKFWETCYNVSYKLYII